MTVLDKETGLIETILDTATTSISTSYLITQTKQKEDGINCTQWFPDYKFDKRFELK